MVAVIAAALAVAAFATPRAVPANPSGVRMPVGNLRGWRQVFAEDFTKPAPLGSFANRCSPDKVVYTGSSGTKWVEYPNCYHDTRHVGSGGYDGRHVLSVHDGVLDYWLHAVKGKAVAANPSPLIGRRSGYQTYGRFSARMRVDSHHLRDYYIAWLLWPRDNSAWQCAESDFPEGPLAGTSVSYFAHHGCHGAQDTRRVRVDLTRWHTYTQIWKPGKRAYYIDGRLVGRSTTRVWSHPERWQLQVETLSDGRSSGHVLVDWVTVYRYVPALG
jgi:hypothetical protein